MMNLMIIAMKGIGNTQKTVGRHTIEKNAANGRLLIDVWRSGVQIWIITVIMSAFGVLKIDIVTKIRRVHDCGHYC